MEGLRLSRESIFQESPLPPPLPPPSPPAEGVQGSGEVRVGRFRALLRGRRGDTPLGGRARGALEGGAGCGHKAGLGHVEKGRGATVQVEGTVSKDWREIVA